MKIILAQVSIAGLMASVSASALAQAPVSVDVTPWQLSAPLGADADRVSLNAPFTAYVVASDALLSTALIEPEWRALQLLDSGLLDIVLVRPDCE